MDDIQRKLALIDSQLAGGEDLHKQIISTCPLLFAAVGLIAGILIQNTFDIPLLFWLIVLAPCAVSAVLLFAVRKADKPTSYALVLLSSCALICFICLGAIRLTCYSQPAPDDIRNLVGADRKLATIRGLVITTPTIRKNTQWQFARFKPTDPSSSFYLKMHEVKTPNSWAKTTGMVRVQVNEAVLDLKAGDYIEAYCWLQRFKPQRNPGQFDTAKYLARKNIFVAAGIKSRVGIKKRPLSAENPTALSPSRASSVFTRFKHRLRENIAGALLGDVTLDTQSRGLLEALLLGYRGNIDADTYRAFRKTGLLHFISLSGMHLGILIGSIWWLAKTAGLMKRGRAVVCIMALCIFLLVVPPRPPTLRAAIISLVFCMSAFFARRSSPLNTLSLAAIVLLLLRPTGLFEAGWQLSFASVLGIICFTNRIDSFLNTKTTGLLAVAKSLNKKPLAATIIACRKLFAVGLAAWLGGAGVLLYHFYTINPFTSIWTVVAFPLVALILVAGYLKILLALLLPTTAVIFSPIVTGLSDSLIWIVKGISTWGLSEILIGKVSLVLIIWYYCAVLFKRFAPGPLLLRKVVPATSFLAIVIFLGGVKWQTTHRDNLAITCLDVGHGQAIFVQLPGKANMLFDAGSLHNSDIGRRVVAAFLNYKGINKIDRIVISHDDLDHINGIPEVIEHCRIEGLYANKAFLGETNQQAPVRFLHKWLAEKDLAIQPWEKGTEIYRGAHINTIWPTEQACEDVSLGDNDKSTVSLIEFAGRKVLLCSDIEAASQRMLLKIYPDLKADIVVVPHHGSTRTLDNDFLEALEANILILSCDRTQYKRWRQSNEPNNSEAFYTAVDGTITISINKDGKITCSTFMTKK